MSRSPLCVAIMLLYNKVYFQSIKPILQAWLWAKKVLFFCEFLKSLYFACSGGMSTTRVLIVLKYYLILFCSSTSQKVKPRPSQAGASHGYQQWPIIIGNII
jgi:hypothetical protein